MKVIKTIKSASLLLKYISLSVLLTLSAMVFAQSDRSTESFIDDALIRSSAILAAAELALEKSTSQEVRGYAQRITSEYNTINNQLRGLADTKDLKVADDDDLSRRSQDLVLNVQQQDEFDVAYGNNQVPAIQQIVLIFQDAANSKDYDTRTLATATLPKIRRHLLMAEQLLAATTETRTDIYQSRDNQLERDDGQGSTRVPSTDSLYPQ